MSSKQKAAKKAPAKAEAPMIDVPKTAGKPPSAMVLARHGDGMRQRAGRGFSYAELSEARLSPADSMKMGLAVDHLRRSMLPSNVDLLKGWYTPPPIVSTAKEPKAKAPSTTPKAAKKAKASPKKPAKKKA